MEQFSCFSNSSNEKLLHLFVDHLQGERGLAPSTVVTYRHHVKTFLEETSKNYSPTFTVKRFIPYLERLKEKKLRACTLFCAAMALRAFFRFLEANGHIESDPSADFPLPKLTSRIPEPLSVDEVEQLISAPPQCRWPGPRDRALLEILYCGLRIGEAINLNIDHLHLEAGYIKVFGKGSIERLVPIGGKAREALESYLRDRGRKFGGLNGPLFVSKREKRLSKSAFWRNLQGYARRARIARRVYPHLLRHSFSVHLLAGRADLRSLQILLGHSSLASTQKYLHLDWNTLKETCERAHPRF